MLLNSHIPAYTRCPVGKVCGLVRSTWGASLGETWGCTCIPLEPRPPLTGGGLVWEKSCAEKFSAANCGLIFLEQRGFL